MKRILKALRAVIQLVWSWVSMFLLCFGVAIMLALYHSKLVLAIVLTITIVLVYARIREWHYKQLRKWTPEEYKEMYSSITKMSKPMFLSLGLVGLVLTIAGVGLLWFLDHPTYETVQESTAYLLGMTEHADETFDEHDFTFEFMYYTPTFVCGTMAVSVTEFYTMQNIYSTIADFSDKEPSELTKGEQAQLSKAWNDVHELEDAMDKVTAAYGRHALFGFFLLALAGMCKLPAKWFLDYIYIKRKSEKSNASNNVQT